MGSSNFRVLSGFNQNFRYKGKTYHIQTEDSGRGNATIMTHIYLGGVILSTARQTYHDLLSLPDWEDLLRERMKVQHLEQIRKLFSGTFESQVGNTAGDD